MYAAVRTEPPAGYRRRDARDGRAAGRRTPALGLIRAAVRRPRRPPGSPSATTRASRAPVVQRQIQRLDRHLAGLRELGGASLEQQRVADTQGTLGRPGGFVLSAQEQSAAAQLVDAEVPEQRQQLIASVAVEPADATQPLEGALEAALRGPCGLAGEGRARSSPGGHPRPRIRQRPRSAIAGAEASGPIQHVLESRAWCGRQIAGSGNLVPDRWGRRGSRPRPPPAPSATGAWRRRRSPRRAVRRPRWISGPGPAASGSRPRPRGPGAARVAERERRVPALAARGARCALGAADVRASRSRGCVAFGALDDTTGRASKCCSRAQIVQFCRRRLCRQKVGIAY